MRSFFRTLAPFALVLAIGCGDSGRKESIQRTNAGHKALGAKQFDTAINEYKDAIAAYRDNHAAHYYMGEAYRGKKMFDKASEGYAEAVRIKPDNVMYQTSGKSQVFRSISSRGRGSPC